jgi:hypothetical protein
MAIEEIVGYGIHIKSVPVSGLRKFFHPLFHGVIIGGAMKPLGLINICTAASLWPAHRSPALFSVARYGRVRVPFETRWQSRSSIHQP